VCVIGSDLATNLFPGESALSARGFPLQRHDFEVVGVLEKQGGFPDSGGVDSGVIVPLAQFTSAFWHKPGLRDSGQGEGPRRNWTTPRRNCARAAPVPAHRAGRSG
jgi:hypothetical protein